MNAEDYQELLEDTQSSIQEYIYAMDSLIDAAGSEEFTNNATTASNAIPKPASTFNGLLIFLEMVRFS